MFILDDVARKLHLNDTCNILLVINGSINECYKPGQSLILPSHAIIHKFKPPPLPKDTNIRSKHFKVQNPQSTPSFYVQSNPLKRQKTH